MLVDCVDILRSITKSCGDNVGGVNKRVWITQLQQIERYTFDSLGYVNSITTKEIGATNYGYELKKVISKKGSHSGNVEAIENVNVDVFKHTAILKAYATTPEQRDSLVSLYGASKVVVFFETDNGEIEIYGLENGLYATALTGNTGEQMQDDTAFTFTLSGLQTSLPKYFLYGGSLATSIAYLDEIGLNPIYVIQEYSAGTSTIDFTNNGGDDWTVGFKIAVNNMPSGWSVDDYDYSVMFVQSGTQTLIESGTKTADYDVTTNLTGNGAGVYAMSAQYNMTNGIDNLYILIGQLIKVDGSGNVLGSIKNNGLIVNSINGLDINYTVDIEQVGVSEQLNVDAIDSVTFNNTNLSHSENDTITLPLGTGAIAVYTDLDPTFWVDLGSLLSNPIGVGNVYLTIIS